MFVAIRCARKKINYKYLYKQKKYQAINLVRIGNHYKHSLKYPLKVSILLTSVIIKTA